MASLQARIDSGDLLILDGAMGTELQFRGVPMDRVAWSGAAIATHADVLRAIHEDYIRAGADIIITNTFGASRHVLEPAGLGDRVAELNKRAATVAREAIERAAEGRQVWVAGSISSFLPENDDQQAPPLAQAKANYREQAALLAEAGVDLITLEMMQDIEHSGYAIEAAVATGLPVWVGFSCRFGQDGESIVLWPKGSETLFADALKAVVGAGGSLFGVMHSDVEMAGPALQILKEHWRGPIAVYPHSGHFVMPDWQFVDIIAPEDFVTEAQTWVAEGAQVVGGCCGIGPAHIRLLKEKLTQSPR